MIDRFVRRLVPSAAVLGRSRLAPLLDLADRAVTWRHPEWRGLPPASLRVRIGVGNRILMNQRDFLDHGRRTVEELDRRGCLRPGAAVLELGCGCGRNAIALAGYLDETGRYVGQDVDAEMIDWCRRHLSGGRFRFFHADVHSAVYNPGGRRLSDYRLPCDDGTADTVIAVSVFSHLLHEDFVRYLEECGRVLAREGRLYMTLFLMDAIRPRLGDRWSFAHRRGEAYIESPSLPEAAVAYDLATVERALAEAGLTIVDLYNEEFHQQTLILAPAEGPPASG